MRVGVLMCGRRHRRSQPAGRRVRAASGVYGTRARPQVAALATREPAARWRSLVTKGQPDPLGWGRKRAAAGRSSCRAVRVVDATILPRQRPARGEVQSRNAIEIRVNGRNVPSGSRLT